MSRYVKMLDAESKVHRIDVFERRRKKWEVREEKQAGKRDERRSHWPEVQTGRRRRASFKLPSR
jgi:hypothetical protein